MQIQQRSISPENPPFIIAELSANHNGSLDRALESVKSAKQAGADAIKLQSYTADTLTIDSDGSDFQIKGGLWDGQTLYDLYQQAHTPFEWHKIIFEYAKQLDIICFSTPFDETAVDLLEDLDCPAYKIASFEAVDLPLVTYVARTGKPMIISTGMADEIEIREVVSTARDGGCGDLALLHCVSAYPAPPEQTNLRMIPELAHCHGVVSGLSDHSLGVNIALASIALGACIIEKHFTLDRTEKGPDSEFSIEPDELAQLCDESKRVWSALGKVDYTRQKAEEENIKFRRSIYIVKDVKAGEVLTSDNMRRIRPGFGLPPKYYNNLLGKKAKVDLLKGTPVDWSLVC